MQINAVDIWYILVKQWMICITRPVFIAVLFHITAEQPLTFWIPAWSASDHCLMHGSRASVLESTVKRMSEPPPAVHHDDRMGVSAVPLWEMTWQREAARKRWWPLRDRGGRREKKLTPGQQCGTAIREGLPVQLNVEPGTFWIHPKHKLISRASFEKLFRSQWVLLFALYPSPQCGCEWGRESEWRDVCVPQTISCAMSIKMSHSKPDNGVSWRTKQRLLFTLIIGVYASFVSPWCEHPGWIVGLAQPPLGHLGVKKHFLGI